MNSQRPDRGDDGAALVIALIFVTIIGVVITAGLTFADTDFRITLSIREQRNTVYAADAAIERAIVAYQADPESQPCVSPPALNGVTVTISCSFDYSRSNAPANAPRLAVTALADPATESGVVAQSGSPTRIRGGVATTSRLDASSGTELQVAGQILAKGDPTSSDPNRGCLPNPELVIRLSAVSTKDCRYSPAPGSDLAVDPAGAAPSAWRHAQYGNPPPAVVSNAALGLLEAACTASSAPVYMPVGGGTYESRAALNQMFNVCKGNTIIFPANPVSLAVPAIFYFNFKDAGNNHQWDIGGSVAAPQNVIGGNTTGSSILGSRCSTTAANPNGVQFIFGGDSTVSIGAANVELCAQHDPTDVNQEIAIYGLKETEGPPVLVNRYEAQSVCFGPGPDCSLISTGSQTGLAIHGTVYAPLARLDIMNVQTDPVTTYQVFSRGVIVRSLRTLMTPANACGALAPPLPEPCFPFQLPADRTGPTDVVFVAKVDNRVRVRAWVFFPGTGIAPQVQAWSVVNEP